MGDEAEGGGADVDELCLRGVFGKPSQAEETQHRIDRAHPQKLVRQVQWAVLEGETLEEEVVYKHLLESNLPGGEEFLEARLCPCVVCKGLLAPAVPLQGCFAIVVNTTASLVNLLQHLFGNLQAVVQGRGRRGGGDGRNGSDGGQ